MPRLGEKLMTCPGCLKRGVSVRLRANDEDHYGCRYCDWYAYTSGYDAIDVQRRKELAKYNEDKVFTD